MGILAATDQPRGADLARSEFAGELRPIRGALAMALTVAAAGGHSLLIL